VRETDLHGKGKCRECWVGGKYCASLREAERVLRAMALKKDPEADISYWTIVNAERSGKHEICGIPFSFTKPDKIPVDAAFGLCRRQGEPLIKKPIKQYLGHYSY